MRCKTNTRGSRCFTPLIEICPSTSQILLDLDSCGGCPAIPALLLRRGGCVEQELVCEPPPEPQVCGCCPTLTKRPRWVTKTQPSVIYPLHDIDCNGMYVFVLDDKLMELGFGRLEATILVEDDGTYPAERYHTSEKNYAVTPIRFDVDYLPYQMPLRGITTASLAPQRGC